MELIIETIDEDFVKPSSSKLTETISKTISRQNNKLSYLRKNGMLNVDPDFIKWRLAYPEIIGIITHLKTIKLLHDYNNHNVNCKQDIIDIINDIFN